MTRSEIHASRRGVLKAGLAIGGGLLMSFRVDAALALPGTKPFRPNAFLTIGVDGDVVLSLPKSEMGQGVFTSIAMLAAEELDIDLNQIRVEIPPGEHERFGKVTQETGGSTSIRDTWEPVRTAAAAARAMLVDAAAAHWGVQAGECRVERGEVTHDTMGRRMPYRMLADAAAVRPAPGKVTLKSPENYRIIGKATRRLDAAGSVDGSKMYGIDVKLPGMKIATFAASPVIGGRLWAIDEAAAMRLPGVRQIVKMVDAVAVIADHYWAAKKGLEALGAQWDEGANAALDQSDIVRSLAEALTKAGVEASHTGDVEAAMAGARRKVEAVYEQPFLAHAAMEPGNCTVHVRPDSCEVWTGTQIPAAARDVAAAAAGLPVEKVQIHNFPLGGAFGRRLEADMVERAVRIGRHVQGPVKVIWSREEDIQHDLYRPYYMDRIAAGLDAAGKPLAWNHRIAGSSIMARLYPDDFNGVDLDAVDGAAETLYALPNSRVEYVRQESPVTTSWWRGVGPLRNSFVIESFIDELAVAAGTDPLDYRRSLLRDPRAKAVLELAAEKAGWGARLPRGQGLGMALLHGWDTYLAQVAHVAVNGEGTIRIKRVIVAVDCGQPINPAGIRAQMEGGVIFGMSAALHGEITIAGGRVEQSNFGDYPVLRMHEAPAVETHLVASHERPGGIGEPPTAAAAAALANALYAATGKRVRTLPIAKAFAA